MKILAICLFFLLCACQTQQVVSNWPQKVVVVLAHPDDETMIAVTLLRLLEAKVDIHLVYVTQGGGGKVLREKDGKRVPEKISLEEMKKIRMSELSEALNRLNITHFTILDFPDQPLRDKVTDKPTRDVEKFLGAKIWEADKVQENIRKVLEIIGPQMVISMGLDSENHSHHKAVRILTEKALKQLSSQPSFYAFEETFWVKEGKREPRSHEVRVSTAGKPNASLKNSYADMAYHAAEAHKSQAVAYTGPIIGHEVLYRVNDFAAPAWFEAALK